MGHIGFNFKRFKIYVPYVPYVFKNMHRVTLPMSFDENQLDASVQIISCGTKCLFFCGIVSHKTQQP